MFFAVLCFTQCFAYTLFSNKESEYAIVLDASASESEKYAASELQKWLFEISGTQLPIVEDNNWKKGKRVIIGDNDISRNVYSKMKKYSEDDESFEYKNVRGDIIIYGGRKRGTLYGVYTLLEKEFGCRWYTKYVSVIPSKTTYKFRRLRNSESPAFNIRHIFYYDAKDGDWMVRNKINQVNAYPPSVPKSLHGDSYVFCGTHTFLEYIPEEKYFKTHPEYFSEIKGKRVAGKRSQLCLSNPEVKKLCVEGLLKTIQQYPDYYAYSLSQNDGYNSCQCKDCRELVSKYGGESGALLWFVNQVAKEVKKVYPSKYISTLAYQYTLPAPKNIQPEDNVIVVLCDIDQCAVHSWKTCPENTVFYKALLDWTSISDNIYVADYVGNYVSYSCPLPNFNVFNEKLQLCKDLGCLGVREYGVNSAPSGEFADMRSYVLSKMLWDPTVDVDYWVNDFIYGYYQKAGKYVREYYDYLMSSLGDNNHIHTSDTYTNNYYSDELIRTSLQILQKASEVADNQAIRNRVESLQLSMSYLHCKKHPKEAKADGSYELVKRVIKRDRITQMGHGESLEDFYNNMSNEQVSLNNEDNSHKTKIRKAVSRITSYVKSLFMA